MPQTDELECIIA